MKTMTKLETARCAGDLLERPRYFPRQLITPADMTLEQNYFRDKMRRHNRLLHGWGVVCGARVCLVPKPDQSDAEPWKVEVHPGYLLSPQGDEILIERERVVDLRTEGVSNVCGQPTGDAHDPWCSDVFIRRQDEDGDITLYVAVKYKEVLTRPVRSQPASCGCADTQCEYSRFCDSYEIGLLSRCPDSHKNPPVIALEDLFPGKLLDCPECPDDPWVVLAKVVVARNGVVQEIDNCSCRRIVVSFSRVWRQCVSFTLDAVPLALEENKPNQTLRLSGTNLISDPLPQINLGAGVKVNSVVADGTQLVIGVDVADKTAGVRNLRVTLPDCSTAVTQITITPKPALGPLPEAAPKPPTPSRPETAPAPKKAPERKGGK